MACSASLATDVSGAKVSEMRYLPYGGTRSGEMPTDRQFTGQRKQAYTKMPWGLTCRGATVGLMADRLPATKARTRSPLP